MIRSFFRSLKYRMMARQLRKPSGSIGIKVGDMMNKANGRLYDLLLPVMNPVSGQSLLEIGFGNGKMFSRVYAAAKGLKLTGLDFSSGMVAAAKENNLDLLQEGGLNIYQGSSDNMPFEKGSFDKIYCINVIYFWDEPARHLAEIMRVLKPGGRFYAVIRTKETMEKMPFTRYGFNIFPEEKWKGLFTDAGLHCKESVFITEPAVEFDEKKFQAYSICLVAEKE